MIDLGQIYKEQFQKQFPYFGGARFEITYHTVSQSSYDRATGVVTDGAETVHPPFSALWDKTKLEQLPGVVVEDDETGIEFPALDLPATPKPEDYFIRTDDSSRWRIMAIYPDNFGASYILKAKRYRG